MQSLTLDYLISVCLQPLLLLVVLEDQDTTAQVTQGAKITGATSGATGFLFRGVTSDNRLELITVSGNFNVGENLISSAQPTSANKSILRRYK